jgi:hypothetical protein
MRKYRILELVITRDQTRYALHAPSRPKRERLEPSLVSRRIRTSVRET